MSDEPLKLSLRAPIQAHGETLHALTLRVPAGADMTACGLPPVALSMSSPEFGAYVATMTARLAGIPPSSVAQLHRLDWVAAAAGVLGFFREPEDQQSPSTSISTSHTPSATSAG